MNSRERHFLMQCQKLSKTSREKFKVGSIIVKGNRILSMGVNSSKTNPKSNSRFKGRCAEFNAVFGAGLNELRGATAFVYRGTKDGCPGNSKPCQSCHNLLRKTKIKKVYFSIAEFPFWSYYEI